ncbi:coproporphyrinogen-III oxidase family protein [Nannocystaceae bacterium ST9]
MSVSAGGEPAGLYVHVPFCARACPYCDFDFEVAGSRLAPALERWQAGLAREFEARRGHFEGREFDSLYLGGGTPSAIGPAALERVIAWLRSQVIGEHAALRELTVELNPEHVDDALVEALVRVGVDRVSLGIQSLAGAGLQQLGRAHSASQALHALERTIAAGLRTSADLIVGWPGHREDDLLADLDRLVDAGVEHLSIYALTIEADTPWHKLVRRGLRVLPDDDAQAPLLIAAERRLGERGFVHYEVASHARPGREAWHNGKYWRSVDVLALGPSGASVELVASDRGLEVQRRRNRRGLERWLADPGEPEEPIDRLAGEVAAGEALWLALRRLDGLAVEPWLARFGVGFGVDRGWLRARTDKQVRLGNLEWVGAALLRVAPGRWLWHDDIAADLL